ncbi:hypothetical protein B0H14DRAFT_3487658 [Mycena olivaceomarginata]|nr:hypothetical protein B0H14DRAFT_3487658 [Mycena olivaceomarginata]
MAKQVSVSVSVKSDVTKRSYHFPLATHKHPQDASDAFNTMFEGIWETFTRRTRSGREFSALSLPTEITPLCAPDFDFAPLLARAVHAEGEDQDDHEDEDMSSEEEDMLNDEELLPPGPSEGIDDNALPCPHKRRRYRHASPSFEQVITSAEKSHQGPHRQRAAKPHWLARKLEAAKARRQAKRSRKKKGEGHVPSASTIHEHVKPATPLATGLDASTLPSTFGACAGKVEGASEKYGSKVRRSLPNLIGLGFRLVDWDGLTSKPIIDSKGRIIAVLAGQPNHPEYRETVVLAFQAVCDAGDEARFPASMRKHRRGLFAAINAGLSYGKGQKTRHVKRMAGFADVADFSATAVFALWAPRLYAHYRDCDTKLDNSHPNLRRPFVGSVFFCAAFNFGRSVWTFRHRDVLNLVFGWCAIQALGKFGATKGGHLVLWDLKLVVEFPAGALILLPSATIAHSNVPVQNGEERISFTQFSASGIFRYVDNGCQTTNA